jgi:uncharacterized membrane protein
MWYALPGIIATLFAGGTALTLAIGRAVKWHNETKHGRLPAEPHERALALLEERFALGDIDRDDYLERRGYLALEAERITQRR